MRKDFDKWKAFENAGELHYCIRVTDCNEVIKDDSQIVAEISSGVRFQSIYIFLLRNKDRFAELENKEIHVTPIFLPAEFEGIKWFNKDIQKCYEEGRERITGYYKDYLEYVKQGEETYDNERNVSKFKLSYEVTYGKDKVCFSVERSVLDYRNFPELSKVMVPNKDYYMSFTKAPFNHMENYKCHTSFDRHGQYYEIQDTVHPMTIRIYEQDLYTDIHEVYGKQRDIALSGLRSSLWLMHRMDNQVFKEEDPSRGILDSKYEAPDRTDFMKQIEEKVNSLKESYIEDHEGKPFKEYLKSKLGMEQYEYAKFALGELRRDKENDLNYEYYRGINKDPEIKTEKIYLNICKRINNLLDKKNKDYCGERVINRYEKLVDRLNNLSQSEFNKNDTSKCYENLAELKGIEDSMFNNRIKFSQKDLFKFDDLNKKVKDILEEAPKKLLAINDKVENRIQEVLQDKDKTQHIGFDWNDNYSK